MVVKHRVSAFFGTDLDVILRSQGVDTLLLMGHATSGVILSTVRYAADADYQLVVIEDGCADRDPEVHALLMEKIFPRQATVTSSKEAVEALAASKLWVNWPLTTIARSRKLEEDDHAQLRIHLAAGRQQDIGIHH